MAGLKGLAAKLFAKQGLAQEFDPESEPPIDDDDDDEEKQNRGLASDSDESANEDTRGTEHYVQVGKSRLRQNQPIALGPAYRGVRVSRAQLEQGSVDSHENEDEDENDGDDGEDDGEDDSEEFDDPDNVDLEGTEDVDSDDEIDSDDAFGTDDEDLIKKFVFRGSSKPRLANGKSRRNQERDEDEDEEEEDKREEDSGDDEDDDDDDDGEGTNLENLGSDDSQSDTGSDEDNDEEDEDVDATTAKAQAETRKILAEERKQVLASLSQSAKADADKGFAVRLQRRTFDALLNMRIRMQRALAAANTLHTVSADATGGSVDRSELEGAAEKAVELLRVMQNIRASFYGGVPMESPRAKRKRSEDDAVNNDEADRSCQAIFELMAQDEEAASAKRRKVLDRWTSRVQRPSAPSAAGASRRFAGPSAQQSLTAVLDGQLVTPDRLIRRTRTPRSCAPVQAAKRVEEDPEIYDDADFYQLLLKELVDQRTVDGSAAAGTAPSVRWASAAAKEAKTRKQVDRKASKGRKMRFNVHAKLQNFAAPEDRRDWEPEAVDRLFSSLFGQRVELREDDGADDDEDDDDDLNGGVRLNGDGSLRLF